jgi:hypothetical protein
MNKNDELVISYLSGDLSGSELESFELDLRSSDQLKKLVEEYSGVFDTVNKQKYIEGNYFYFENILPKFYARQKPGNKVLLSRKFAYASVIVIFMLVSFIFFNNNQSSYGTDIEKIAQEISPDQIRAVVDNYSLVENSDLNLIDSNSMLIQQINSIYNNAAESITKGYRVEDLTENLTDAEVDQIYSELVNKKIL